MYRKHVVSYREATFKGQILYMRRPSEPTFHVCCALACHQERSGPQWTPAQVPNQSSDFEIIDFHKVLHRIGFPVEIADFPEMVSYRGMGFVR